MHRSRAFSITGCLLGLLALNGSCGGSANKQPAAEAPAAGGDTPVATPEPGEPAEPAELAPQDAPDALLAVFIAAHPDAQLRGLAELVDAVQPGAAAAMKPGSLVEQITILYGGLPASAFDMEKPMYLLVLDGQENPLVLVGAIADREALTKNLGEGAAMRIQQGYAAIGTPEALEVAAGYALTRLREEPLPAGVLQPSALTIVLRFEQIMKRHPGEVTASLRALPGAVSDPGIQKLIETYGAPLEALAQQIKTMRFHIESSTMGLHLNIGLDALPGTTLSAFARAQTPSDFALFSSALTSDLDFYMGGQLDYSALPSAPSAPWALHLGASIDDARANDAVRAHMKRWLTLTGKEFGMGARFDATDRVSQRVQVRVDDEKEARALIAEWLALVKRHPDAFTYRKPRVQTARVQGVQVHTLTAELGGTPEEQQMMSSFYGPKVTAALAVANGRLSMAVGQNAQTLMREMLTREQAGKAAEVKAGVSAILGMADAQQKRDSMTIHLDLASAVMRGLGKGTPRRTEPAISVDLGFKGDSAECRIYVPTEQIAGVMAAVQSP